MVNAARQDDQVTLLEPDPDPVIGLTPREDAHGRSSSPSLRRYLPSSQVRQ
jgi:hypothetical protein